MSFSCTERADLEVKKNNGILMARPRGLEAVCTTHNTHRENGGNINSWPRPAEGSLNTGL